jgi:HlyD family type I secretion membrane fusion protein
METKTSQLHPMTSIDASAKGLINVQALDGDGQRPFPLRLMQIGFLLVGLFLVSLSVWSSLAPIEGAVVSHGIISVASFRKQVQHLEGGIVETIHVSDGDKVVSGQLLVQLRDIKPAAELRQLEGEYIEAQAVVARLIAERDNFDEINFPQELIVQAEDSAISSVMSGQSSILHSNRTLMKDRQAVLEKKIDQTQEEISGLQGLIKEKNNQRQLILAESEITEKALRKGLVPRAEGLKIKQRLAETKGEVIAYRSEVGRLEQSILELRLQMSEILAKRIAEIAIQLRIERALLFDLSHEIITARDVLHRTKIVSPIDGLVVNLQIHSHEGVIKAGQPLMEVVPGDDELVVEAIIDPDDIDEVWIGMPANVVLTSASRRQRVPMEGIVSHVSADRLTDPQTGNDYYRARIELSPESVGSVNAGLVAGMGAEVFLRTVARTPLDYLLSPITNSLRLGLREK